MAAGTAARAVMVIGAHGVQGSALVRAFEDAGWRVVRGVRRSDGARGLQRRGARPP
jgi:nucleoside-diphosphate-sugar epimerase